MELIRLMKCEGVEVWINPGEITEVSNVDGEWMVTTKDMYYGVSEELATKIIKVYARHL